MILAALCLAQVDYSQQSSAKLASNINPNIDVLPCKAQFCHVRINIIVKLIHSTSSSSNVRIMEVFNLPTRCPSPSVFCIFLWCASSALALLPHSIQILALVPYLLLFTVCVQDPHLGLSPCVVLDVLLAKHATSRAYL